MAEIDDLYSALEKADAAGNAGDAREIANMIRQLEGAKPPAEGIQPKPKRGEKGFLDSGGGLEAFAVNAADSATFGAASPVAAYVASRLSGRPYDEVRAEQQSYRRELDAENPWSAGAGSLAGALVPGVGAAKVAGRVAPGMLARVTPQAGEGAAKTAGRLALGGGTAGVVSNLAETGVDIAERELGGADTVSKTPISDAAVAGTIGAVAGPVVGGAVGMARRAGARIADAVRGEQLGGGWRHIAKKLDVDPDVLSRAMRDYEAATGGQRASIAQVLDMRQQGVLRELGQDSTRAGVVLREAADEAAEALPDQMRDTLRRATGLTRSADEMELATRQPADRFMHDAQGRRIADNVDLTPGEIRALRRPDFIAATRDLPPELRSRVASALQGQGRLSTDELDIMRRHVQSWGDAVPGNKATALTLQRQLEDIAERSSPGYKQNVVQATEAGKLREEGFAAGQSLETNTGAAGGALRQGASAEGYAEGLGRRSYDLAGQGPQGAMRAADELSSNRNVQDAFNSAYGTSATEDLVTGARALRQGQRALETVAPSRPGGSGAAEDARGLADVGAATVATIHGSQAGMVHRIAKALPRGISDKTAEQLARMLTSANPREVNQAVANLRRAGAQNSDIAELQSLAARIAGDRSDIRRERRVPLQVNVRKRAGQ